MTNSAAGKNSMWRFCRHWLIGLFAPDLLLRNKYSSFRKVLQLDGDALELLAELESHILGYNPADHYRICHLCDQVIASVGAMADQLCVMNPPAYSQLLEIHAGLSQEIKAMTAGAVPKSSPPYILELKEAADYPHLAGGKATNLSAARRAGVSIPDGFVITTNAFHRFILDNNLEKEIVRCFQLVHAADNETIVRITGEMQELILGSKVPAEVVREIQEGVKALKSVQLLAVRSSALAEDHEVSFAGQYSSELDVPVESVIDAYKSVIAGKYCPRAITYRIRHGLSDADTAMAVLVIPMIHPRTSGVVYTLDPAPPGSGDFLGVYAVSGLAEGLVDGSRTPEKYYLPRGDSVDSAQEYLAPDNALLNTSELQQLQRWGLQLETYFALPQDVEWAIDGEKLTVLQSRRMHREKDPAPAPVQADDVTNLLYSDLHCASSGISCGSVFVALNGKAFRDIPVGSVVFTTTLRPALSQFLDRVVGVVAANGSRASHFASVARERGIPVLVGSQVKLSAGQVVTIDAVSGRIFHGCVNAVLQSVQPDLSKDFPTRKYTNLAARTTHLVLTDPDGATFNPAQCRSMHDIVRFCHEKSVQEMFSLVGRKGRGLGQARKLVTELPLVMYVLDLESRKSAGGEATITLEDLTSIPMLACWQGMSDPRIYWDTSQHHVDWEGFDQVSAGIFSLDTRLLASYALVSREYLHLNIRFGYHFSIVDAICGELASTNYINFRFKGGGAQHQQQLYRLQFIDQVLTAFGFETSIRGDMLDAALTRTPLAATEIALTRLGMLLAATRMMDMHLTSERQATEEAEKFILMVSSCPSMPV